MEIHPTFRSGSYLKSSGYQIIYTIPHISINTKKNLKFSFHAEIPAYRDYNGIQPGNKMAISARVTFPIIIQ
ncbi:MAG: hypothetical protein Q8O72_17155 [Bacteroidales bacterium]|nr:hypothetical protein [Bacteroidales bacterium]